MKRYTPSTVILAVVLAVITYCFLIACGRAAEPAKAGTPNGELFRAGEFNLELGGLASLGNAQRSKDDVRYGIGLGANYWFTRGFGVGLRAEGEDTHGLLVDRASARLSVRAPLWDTVAPYGYFDGIRSMEEDRWEAGAGGGLEWRPLNGRLGFFAEAGLEVTTRGEGRMRGGAGVRFPF